MVHVALEAAETATKRGIEAEIVDLRTILPFDAQTCIDSVRRTGRLIVLQEAQYTGGLGHTVSSRILEEAFWNLEPLEDHTIPTSDLVVRHIRRMCE